VPVHSHLVINGTAVVNVTASTGGEGRGLSAANGPDRTNELQELSARSSSRTYAHNLYFLIFVFDQRT
jgi:hypothetical protein